MSVKQLPGVIDLDMLQRFEFERYLFDHAIPCDRETLSGTKTGAQVTGLSQSGTDGTARGGILVAIAEKFQLPIHFIGVGESAYDGTVKNLGV